MLYLKLLIIVTSTLLALTSCYRMPDPDECSVIPTTNNPQVIGNHGSNSWMPGAGF